MKKYKNAAYDDEYIDLLIYNINKKIKEERIMRLKKIQMEKIKNLRNKLNEKKNKKKIYLVKQFN